MEFLEWNCGTCRYRMDYMKFVEYHRDQGADITVGCLPVDYERASDFGLMNIDSEGVVTVSPGLHGCNVVCASCMVAIQFQELGAHVLPASVYQVEQIQHSHAMLHFAYLQRRRASLTQVIAALDTHAKEAIACIRDACLLCSYAKCSNA